MSRTARLGFFIFIALILFGLGIFLISKGQFLFRNTYPIKAGFVTVSGLTDGAEVRMGGVRVGTVSKIQLPERPGDKVQVVMEVGHAAMQLIRKDSTASIQTEGLLGNKFVRITFGSAGAAPIRPWDFIAGTPTLDVADIMAKTSEILDTANSALQNIQAATANVKDITEKINSGQGTIGKLINNNQIYRELHATSAEIANTAEQAKAGATGFRENMEALKHNWLFRGYFKKRGYSSETELTQYQIDRIPRTKPEMEFTFDAHDLFGSDNAKLKHKKRLDDIGRYLESHSYGLVVVAAYSDMKGDSGEDLTTTQARALVVREYLVDNFKLRDTQIKTRGMGKRQASAGAPAEGIDISVYSSGADSSNLTQ